MMTLRVFCKTRYVAYLTTALAVATFLFLAAPASAESIHSYDSWQWNGFSRSCAPEVPAVNPWANQSGSTPVDLPMPGVQTPCLSGAVYLDENANGIRESSDWGIAGAVVQLTSVLTGDKSYATTASDGAYIFENVATGTYTLTLLTPSSEPESPVRGILHAGDVVAPKSDWGQVSGLDSFVNIGMDTGYVGENYDFPQLVYPSSLLSKRMLLNEDPGIHHTTPAPEPGTLTLLAVLGLVVGGSLWHKRAASKA
ncbi:MAG: SdrD B-like domain-containing protein [Thermoguttaceae bacterium]